VFRLYIKSLGTKAVYRVEESLKMDSTIGDALHTIIGTAHFKILERVTTLVQNYRGGF